MTLRILFDPRHFAAADLTCRRCRTERNLRWHLLRRLVAAEQVADETLCPKCAAVEVSRPPPSPAHP